MGKGLLGALGRVVGGTARVISEGIGPEWGSVGIALLGGGGVNCRGASGIGFEGGWGDAVPLILGGWGDDPFVLAGVCGGMSSLRGIAGGT